MRVNNQAQPAAVPQALRLLLAICTLAAGLTTAILLTACTRPASQPAVVYATDNAPRIIIERVQVSEGSGIYVHGRSTLPDGECVQSELFAGQEVLDWWPRDVCVEISASQWEILVPLGRGGAPQQLDPAAAYEVHAWWPEQPEEVTTRFPFDLSGPPAP